MSHNQAAMFTDSLSYSICRTFRRSTVLLRAAAEGKVRADAAAQAISGRENVVRAFLAASHCDEFWRRELGDKYFLKLQAGHSLHLAARSHAACRNTR